MMSLSLGAIALLGLVGCDSGPVAGTGTSTVDGSAYVATTEPADAVGVGTAKTDAKDGQPITLVGRIGGSAKPFVDDLAAFTIVDPGVPYCAADEGCSTPWDYCCAQDKVKDNIAVVKIVKADGAPVEADARKLLGVKELSEVVVTGTAARDADGNLAVLAKTVYVKP